MYKSLPYSIRICRVLPSLHGHCQRNNVCARSYPRIESLAHIRYRVQYHIILSVQFGKFRAIFQSQSKKWKIVHKSLEHITRFPRFSRLSDVGDFLRGNTALEITVANLIAARYVWKGNGEIPFAVVWWNELRGILFSPVPCLFPFPANMRVGRRRKRYNLQLLKTWLGRWLLAKRERIRTDMWCLFRYAFQYIRYMVGST